ncbi:MAG: 50S ribosomal protein L29 [Verrucomicrobiota bacterium]
MNNSEIRELSVQELDMKIRDTQSDLLDLRLRKSTNLDKPAELQELRRLAARLQTIRSEKARAESAA